VAHPALKGYGKKPAKHESISQIEEPFTKAQLIYGLQLIFGEASEEIRV